MSNSAIQVIRDKKVLNSSLEAELLLQTSSQEIMAALTDLESPEETEYSLADLFLVSKVSLSLVSMESMTGSGSEGGFATQTSTVDFRGSKGTVQVIAGPASEMSGMGKCGRCWRLLCDKDEELCERCASVEGEPPRLVAQE